MATVTTRDQGIEPAPPQPAAPASGPNAARVTVLAAEDLEGVQPVVIDAAARTIDAAPLDATLTALGPGRAALRQARGAHAHRILLDAPDQPGTPGAARREVVVDGWRFEVEVEPAARAALRERATRDRSEAGRSGPTEVHAIIPGVVVSVSVNAGDDVVAGQQLLVIEAMKMQNELRAPREGTIERVAVATGATIEVGDLLLVIS